MDTKDVNPVVAAIVTIILVGVIGGIFYAVTRPKAPLRAGVDYTPGKPPWQDPKYSGDKTGRGFETAPGAARPTAAR
ncbi:MAG TPA: hypothetical protein VM490_05370 [Armatimonadaceae bacterium]|nr:hypothetical protein [Armatimonadaceae bacterium]